MAYQEHPHCETPADDAVVWRYTDLLKFIDLLVNKTMWFSRADLLDDPREGRLTDLELNQLAERGEIAEGWLRLFETGRKETYINCWHESNCESMAMWDRYGSIAIKSKIGLLKQAVANAERTVYVGRAHYLDWTQDAPWPNNLIGMHFRKIQSYKHESEVRLVIWDPNLKWQVSSQEEQPEVLNLTDVANWMADIIKEQNWVLSGDTKKACIKAVADSLERSRLDGMPPGIRLQVDLVTLFDEIVVGPRQPDWVAQLLRKLVGRYDIMKPVRPSELVYKS